MIEITNAEAHEIAEAACVPPCSLACRVTGGRHHTAGSVRAAALAELANDAPVIERVDRYTITVNGHRVRATEEQEAALRRLDVAGVRRFLTAMGCPIPPATDQESADD